MSSISSSSSSLLLLGLHGRSKNTAGAEGQLTNAAQHYIGKLQNGKIFGSSSSSCTWSGVGQCLRLATRSFAPHKMEIQCAVGGHEGHDSERTYLEEHTSRRPLLMISLISLGSMVSDPACGKVKRRSPYDEKRLLEQNKRIQDANNAPEDFPNFVREGFEVKVVTPENYIKSDSGLFYLDIEVGKGDCPIDGQQVTFHYIGYNESGRRIDSTYLQGSPAKIRLGNKALVPGFEEGIRNMRPGGKRRIIIPPELGPPVGPSTFFSAKQFEVFDVELLTIKDCQRRTIGFYSDVVCE